MLFSISAVSLFAVTATASYAIQDDYTSSSFASMFDFFTDNDPTNGYVNYISQDQAQNSGLYKIDNGAVYMGVDSSNVATGRGRDSIRISSKKEYNHGLFILDLAHMPAGACGSWPAFWLLGPNWPYGGEVDIIEGVNSQTTNNMALHTDAGCSITHTGVFSGTLETDNCDVQAPGQGNNVGCSIHSSDTNSFGLGFNNNGGGVYATEWTSEAINIWFFPRNAIPSDISSGNPNPSGWGQPSGQFTGACDIDSKFKNQKMIFDVTFCGDWAGSVWSTDATCSPKASTCQDYVQNNPNAFKDTYWSINSLKVYSENGAAPTQSSASGTVTYTAPATTLTSTIATTFSTITSEYTITSVPVETTSTFTLTATYQPTTANPEPTTAQPTTVTAPEPTVAPTQTQTAGNGGNNWKSWASDNNNGGGGWGGNGGSWGGGGRGGGGRGGWGGQ